MRALRLMAILALVALLSSIYAIWRALKLTGGLFAPVPAILSPGVPAGTAEAAPNLFKVRLHYCNATTSYSLLSLPREAAFSMGIAPSETPSAILGATTPGIPVTGPQDNDSRGDAGMAISRGYVNAACAEAGIVVDRKLVLCRGHGPSHLIITVHTRAASQAFALALPACGGHATSVTPAIPGGELPADP